MQLGLFLKKYRDAVSMSGYNLSLRIGVSRHSLEKWENAGVMPNYRSAVKVQKYFGLENLENIPENDLHRCIARSLKKPSQLGGTFGKAYTEMDDLFPFYFTNLLSEKDKRIRELEQMIKVLREQNKILKKTNK